MRVTRHAPRATSTGCQTASRWSSRTSHHRDRDGLDRTLRARCCLGTGPDCLIGVTSKPTRPPDVIMGDCWRTPEPSGSRMSMPQRPRERVPRQQADVIGEHAERRGSRPTARSSPPPPCGACWPIAHQTLHAGHARAGGGDAPPALVRTHRHRCVSIETAPIGAAPIGAAPLPASIACPNCHGRRWRGPAPCTAGTNPGEPAPGSRLPGAAIRSSTC